MTQKDNTIFETVVNIYEAICFESGIPNNNDYGELRYFNMKQNIIHISKAELQELVLACERILSFLVSTNLTAQVKYKQLEAVVHSIMNIECLFAYLYAEVEKYGNISDVVNTKSDVYARYTLTASMVFSQPNKMHASIEKLSEVWNQVKSFLQNMNALENSTLQAISKEVNALDAAMCLLTSNRLETKSAANHQDTVLKSKAKL